ncbi:hypothetical protein F7725_007326, partial [Dissostichus mawsoni]
MMSFITALLHTKLKVKGDTEIKLERAHRALAPKPKESSAPPRSIIVRFLDFSVKQIILQQAWKQRDIEFEGQREKGRVREVIKQLKEKNIKAQSPYPAQLKLFLATGVRVFPTLVEAQSTLKELGVDARVEERDILERELTQDKWSTQENWRRNQMQLNPTDRKYMKTKKDAMFWLDIMNQETERMLPFLGQKSWRKLGVENEWMKCTQKVWSIVRKKVEAPLLISRVMEIAKNGDFRPSKLDTGFRNWARKGLIIIDQMFEGDIFSSFKQLQDKF